MFILIYFRSFNKILILIDSTTIDGRLVDRQVLGLL
jgi:hypothetical protein